MSFISIVINTPLSHSYLAATLLRVFTWIATPISSLIDLFSPEPQYHMPDGSVVGIHGFTRASLTSLFNVSAYILLGVIISTQKKTDEE
jgi:hypothetical protein